MPSGTYKLRLFDSKGQWFSTKTVQDFEANGVNVNSAIDGEFKYWQPGTVSAIAVDDSMGQVRRITYLQWNRGRNESMAATLVDQMLSEGVYDPREAEKMIDARWPGLKQHNPHLWEQIRQFVRSGDPDWMNALKAAYPGETITAVREEFGTNPHYTTNAGVKGGDSHVVATAVKKEGDEYQQTGEERREIAIADKILKAAKNMASTPDVEDVVRLATELKKMHGV